MIAVGYRNGIGNSIIFTVVLQALAKISGQPVDVILDDSWKGPGRDSVELIYSKLPFVRRFVGFPSEFRRKDYDQVFMSRHSYLVGDFFRYCYLDMGAEAPHLPFWAFDFLHERDYYLF